MNKDYLYLSAYYILKFLVYTMPHFILNFLAFCVSKIVFKLDKKHRKIIDINLNFAFPIKMKMKEKNLLLKFIIILPNLD